jgi:ABC-type amino acid transport substrate-binding protein
MKYIIKLLLIVTLISGFFLMGCGDDTSLLIDKKIVICTGHTDWWPAMWDENNNIIGIGPDLTSLCLADAGLEMSCTNQGTWSEILAKAKNGEIDIIVGCYWMKEREEYMHFTDKYLSDPVALITSSKSNFKYNGDWKEMNLPAAS